MSNKLPEQKLNRKVRTYRPQIIAKTDAYWTDSFTPESLLEESLELEGFAQSEEQADLMIYLKTGDFEEVEVALENRLRDEEKDSVESNMKFRLVRCCLDLIMRFRT